MSNFSNESFYDNSEQLLIVNYFCEKFHDLCLTESSVRFCIQIQLKTHKVMRTMQESVYC